eukprot:6727474-Lingulodinium_polyedra.AAC.1
MEDPERFDGLERWGGDAALVALKAFADPRTKWRDVDPATFRKGAMVLGKESVIDCVQPASTKTVVAD